MLALALIALIAQVLCQVAALMIEGKPRIEFNRTRYTHAENGRTDEQLVGAVGLLGSLGHGMHARLQKLFFVAGSFSFSVCGRGWKGHVLSLRQAQNGVGHCFWYRWSWGQREGMHVLCLLRVLMFGRCGPGSLKARGILPKAH